MEPFVYVTFFKKLTETFWLKLVSEMRELLMLQ